MSGSGKAEIKIEEGDKTVKIAEKLADKEIIPSKYVFYYYIKFGGKSIKAGDYLLPKNLNIIQIANILSNGDKQVQKMVIPEGWRREQIAQYVSEHFGLSADEFLAKTTKLEGKLFPDTYEITDEPTVDEIVTKMSDDYATRTAGLNVTEGDLILASMIEREAGNDSQRAGIAGVFINRINAGIKLESNPTVQYQKDSNNYSKVGVLNYKFWQELSAGDVKNTTGPNNTYLIPSFPETPICNPGLASIKAALSPEDNDYYYFISDDAGEIHYAKTAAEHQANINKYLK